MIRDFRYWRLYATEMVMESFQEATTAQRIMGPSLKLGAVIIWIKNSLVFRPGDQRWDQRVIPAAAVYEGDELPDEGEDEELAEMVAELNKEVNQRLKEAEQEKLEINQRIEAISREKAQAIRSSDQITHYLQELIRTRKIRARILLAIQLREYHDLLAENQSAN